MPTTLSPAAERVISALAKAPGATAAELVEATGLTRSAVGVALNTLADQGLARSQTPPRQSGFKGKVPARWYPTATSTHDGPGTEATAAASGTDETIADTDTDAGTGAEPEADTAPGATATSSTDTGNRPPQADEPTAHEPTAAEQEPHPDAAQVSTPEQSLPGAPHATLPDQDTRAPGQAEQDAVTADPAAPAGSAGSAGSDEAAGAERLAPVIALPTAPTAPAEPSVASGSAAARVTKSGREHHGKGALHAKVQAWLAAHPDQEVTAGQVGRAIDGSPGAVVLIFDKLITNGHAELVSDKPKKVRWATTPAQTDTPKTGGTAPTGTTTRDGS